MKVFLTLALLVSCLNGVCQSALTDSLDAYYPFSGNANDASGNGNNGTSHGATLTTDRFGNPNSAYYFDGVSSYITYLSNKNFKPTTFPISITAWIKANMSNGNVKVFDNNQTIDTYGGVDITVAAYSGPGGSYSVNYGDGGPFTSGDRRDKENEFNINDNKWHFIAGVIRGPGDMDLFFDCHYVPGVYDGTGGPLGYTNTGGLSGTDNASSNTYYYKGALDEIRLYHRELTLTDLQMIYSFPRPYDSLSVSLGNDTTIKCNSGSSIVLNPSVVGSPLTYTWSNNSTASSISVNQPGDYAITVYDGCRYSSDTVDVAFSTGVQAGIVTSSRDTICEESGLTSILSITDSAWNLQWQSSTDQVHFTSISGATYSRYSTSPNLSQTTSYRAFVKNNDCSDTSNTVVVHIIPAPVANFTYSVSGQQVSFNSAGTSQGITLYSWDFGDSSISELANPTHKFDGSDTFYVCLTVYNGSNCSYTLCKYVSLLTGVQTIDEHNLIDLYPNPANNNINLSVNGISGKYQLKIYNVLGQQVATFNEINLQDKQIISISLDNLPAGNYQMGFCSDKEYFSKQFVHYK